MKKVLIIGGGVAGLSAGVYSQLNGFDTEILEMSITPGGHCTAWDRKHFRFDYCIHWLVGTAKGPYHDIWRETDALNDQVKILDFDIHTKVVDSDGDEFLIYTNLDRWEKYLLEMAPEDTKSIKRMCRDMRKSGSLETFTSPPGMRSLGEMLGMGIKILPLLGMFLKYSKKNCREYLDSMNFKNVKLVSFLGSMLGEKDFSALAFLMMLAWFNQKNAGYPIGGSKPFSDRMNNKFKSLGGTFSRRKKVSKILIENNRAVGVRLADGTEISADYVIGTADGHTMLYEMLERKYLTDQFKEAYENWELFTPLVQVSFGIDTIIPSDAQNITFLNNKAKIGSTVLDSGYFFMNYSFDPTMAPENSSVIVLRFESPWDYWEKLEGEAYQEEKKRIEQDARNLLEKAYPGILDKIKVVDVSTPKTDVRYTGVWKGSYEGFWPASYNITKTLPMTLPDLDNFYMAGQWLFPGGGLPPAGQSGKWAIQLLCKKEKKLFQVR